MKKTLLITTLIMGYSVAKAQEVSEVKTFVLPNNLEIKIGDTIHFNNTDLAHVYSNKRKKQVKINPPFGVIMKISKYKYSDEDLWSFVTLKVDDSTTVYSDLDDALRNREMKVPEGYGYENIRKRQSVHTIYSKDSTVKDWIMDILPVKNGYVTYVDVIQVDNTSKDEIYNRVKLWFAKVFKSSKNVIQLDEKEQGKILAKGNSSVLWHATFLDLINVYVNQMFDISIRDNKVKIEISSIDCEWIAPNGVSCERTLEKFSTWGNGKIYRKDNTYRFYESVDNDIQSTIKSFEMSVKTPVQKSDW